MTSRALRLTLLVLCVGLFAGAGYSIWKAEAESRAADSAAQALASRADAAARTLLEIKATQPGYVAAGQGDDFWASRMDTLLPPAREAVAALHTQARSPRGRTAIETAAATLDDFEQMDKRAREYARRGQRLLASDLVFSDGIEKIDGAVAAVEEARSAELAAAGLLVHEQRRLQLMAAAGAAGGALLILLALVPVPRQPAPAAQPAATSGSAPIQLDLRPSPQAAAAAAQAPAPPRAQARVVAAPETTTAVRGAASGPPPAPAPAPAPLPAVPAVDLSAVAALCSDLSRLTDTQALPGALERAAGLLDAAGIVLWIADPDGRELTPVVAHGYPANLLVRMGTIDRDAKNLTADAFRTGLVQTVNGDTVSPGAVAAPLLTASGPVGVISAEVHSGAERRDATRAVAAIVAAQLATLVGPPSARTTTKAEAAGA